jgi:hypothetical protein
VPRIALRLRRTATYTSSLAVPPYPAGPSAGSAAFPAVWAQAARVEVMRATRRAAVAEADGEATDDEAEAAEEEDELPLGCI